MNIDTIEAYLRSQNVKFAGVAISNDGESVNASVNHYESSTAQERAAADAALAAYLDDKAPREYFAQRRELAAMLWVLVGRLNPPATKAKMKALEDQIVTAFKEQPWLQ